MPILMDILLDNGLMLLLLRNIIFFKARLKPFLSGVNFNYSDLLSSELDTESPTLVVIISGPLNWDMRSTGIQILLKLIFLTFWSFVRSFFFFCLNLK